MLADLARAYVTAINTGAVPTIASAWESVVRIEGAKALERAKAAFDERCGRARLAAAPANTGVHPWHAFISWWARCSTKMRMEAAGGILEADELTALYTKARTDAVALYRKLAIGGYQQEYDDELEVRRIAR